VFSLISVGSVVKLPINATTPLPVLTAVISFCSNDWRFLRRCVEGVAPVCQQVIVTVCDHFFDGSQENYALLQHAFKEFPECHFLAFCFDPLQSYRPCSPLFPEHRNWRHEWHNTGRWLGYLCAPKNTDFFLFLDCDEVVDSTAFLKWLSVADLHKLTACRFACFFHFREAQFEAMEQDDFSLLASARNLLSEYFWEEDERFGLFHRLSGEKMLGVRGCDGKPMIRHYSGVRTQEEFNKKLVSWGHHWERDWQALLEEEYSRPFRGKDFMRYYHYQTVEVDFDPLHASLPLLPEVTWEDYLQDLHHFHNVVKVDRQAAFRRDIENACALSHRYDH
jgi:hypothetical protein